VYGGWGYQRVPESVRFADLFTSHFLMPASGLKKRFNEIRQQEDDKTLTVGSLLSLAHQYGVSVEALVIRLETLRLMHAGTLQNLRRQGLRIRDLQRKLDLGEIPAREDELPLHYQHLAIQAFADGLITEGQLAHLLRVDRLEARHAIKETLERDSDTGGQALQHWPNQYESE
jgi:Zn-dependent peptidase ImmA (M78 family)